MHLAAITLTFIASIALQGCGPSKSTPKTTASPTATKAANTTMPASTTTHSTTTTTTRTTRPATTTARHTTTTTTSTTTDSTPTLPSIDVTTPIVMPDSTPVVPTLNLEGDKRLQNDLDRIPELADHLKVVLKEASREGGALTNGDISDALKEQIDRASEIADELDTDVNDASERMDAPESPSYEQVSEAFRHAKSQMPSPDFGLHPQYSLRRRHQ